MNAYDRRLFVDAALASVALSLLAFAIMFVADEPALSTGDRAARLAALAPLIGGLSTLLVALRAEGRGELLALATTTASRTRALAGAALGGACVGVIGAAALVVGRLPRGALFPRLPSSGLSVTTEGLAHPAVALVDGAFVWRPAAALAAPEVPSAWLVGGSLACSSLLLATLATRRWKASAGAACVLSLAVAAVAGFHVAAQPGGVAGLLAAPIVAGGWLSFTLRAA